MDPDRLAQYRPLWTKCAGSSLVILGYFSTSLPAKGRRRTIQRRFCMLSKHGGGRHNACGALSHMPRAVVGAVLGLVLVRVQGQSEASPIVCMGRFHPLSRGESSMFQLLKAFVFVGSLLWLLHYRTLFRLLNDDMERNRNR